jgi:hypothetical protein
MASDEHVATALKEFATAHLQGSRDGAANDGPLSERRQGERDKQLKGLSERVEAMATDLSPATYLGFAAVWTEAQELGVEVPSEITNGRRERIYAATACKLAHQLMALGATC